MSLDARDAKIGTLVMPRTRETRPQGIVDLSRAKVGTFTDFRDAWPDPVKRSSRACKGRACDEEGRDADHLVLDGFEYEHLDNPDGHERPVPPRLRYPSLRQAASRWMRTTLPELPPGRLWPIGGPRSRGMGWVTWRRGWRIGRVGLRRLLGAFGFEPPSRAARRTWYARREWLHAQSRDDLFERLKPQPWRQLAKVLAAQGHEEDARKIAIERRVAQRFEQGMSPWARCISSLLHAVADYGFNPWKTVGWSAVVVLVCSCVYTGAVYIGCGELRLCHNEKVFVRTVPADFMANRLKIDEPDHELLIRRYPRFDPLLYSLDVFLPLLDAGSERFWRARAKTFWGRMLYYLTVAEQIVGAILLSLVAAGFIGLLTRDER